MQWLIDIVFEKVLELLEGTIIIWSGSIGTVPAGWTLCDGTLGTPDLRDNFVIGAGDNYAVDDSGGNINHTHDFITDGHIHGFELGTGIGGGVVNDEFTASSTDTGTTENNSDPPPYYALAFIMKT